MKYETDDEVVTNKREDKTVEIEIEEMALANKVSEDLVVNASFVTGDRTHLGVIASRQSIHPKVEVGSMEDSQEGKIETSPEIGRVFEEFKEAISSKEETDKILNKVAIKRLPIEIKPIPVDLPLESVIAPSATSQALLLSDIIKNSKDKGRLATQIFILRDTYLCSLVVDL